MIKRKLKDLLSKEWSKRHPHIYVSELIKILFSIRGFEDKNMAPSISQVAQSCDISYNQARTRIRDLEDLGYIEILRSDSKLFVIANGKRIFGSDSLIQVMDKCKEEILEYLNTSKTERHSSSLYRLLDIENPCGFFIYYLKLTRKGMPDILPKIQIQFSSHKLKLKQKGYLLTEEHN
ncbi:MAG TPA: hypothetical protein PLK11_04555 [Methanofastidiosum sp.]|jgi:DNA-binding transcriptional regulator YhcF (GntR family)|nr:hypothetical protein [Methanofastidiosum sp.]HOR88459.1 hypothetical protein [Methanofastidiosum sp.]HPL00602.1 hypothetical protein [Methanofastidiosum sp.]